MHWLTCDAAEIRLDLADCEVELGGALCLLGEVGLLLLATPALLLAPLSLEGHARALLFLQLCCQLGSTFLFQRALQRRGEEEVDVRGLHAKFNVPQYASIWGGRAKACTGLEPSLAFGSLFALLDECLTLGDSLMLLGKACQHLRDDALALCCTLGLRHPRAEEKRKRRDSHPD